MLAAHGQGAAMTDTIFALATGAGRSAIAIVRLSGPRTKDALAALAGGTPAPHVARFSRLRLPASGETLDEGVVIWRPGPKSPTGEDYAELQIHGGRAVIAALVGALGALPGLRPAAPGEFIRRGFLSGKIDLSQAEAIADLIDADTEIQRRQAMRIAAGAFRDRIALWRNGLVQALALVESDLDFSDEADVGALSPRALAALIGPLEADMRAALAAAPASERLRDGFLVLILGPPNAGKSTLLNALARRDVAIVSDIAGTTRDMIELHLDIGGMPVTLVDTAGLRAAEDAIEKIGVARTRARAAEADLCLWLSEGGREPPPDDLAPQDAAREMLCVATKSDLTASGGDLAVSAATGAGLDALCARIAESARRRLGDGGTALVIRARHRRCLEEAARRLGAAQATGLAPELVAENLRLGARALAEIIGAIDVEQLLDEIFSRFCIGK
jgi:tRNA modification GTPase